MLTCQNNTPSNYTHSLPVLSMTHNHRAWRISFSYQNDSDHSFAVEIDHHYSSPDNSDRVKVIAYSHGDKFEVVSRSEFKRRVDDAIAHEQPFGNENESDEWLDALESRVHADMTSRFLVIDHESFWNKVDDCLARWNAMLFLFAPTVCL